MEIKLLQLMGVTFFAGIPFHLHGSETNENNQTPNLISFTGYTVHLTVHEHFAR
jgi:hypothetical protein